MNTRETRRPTTANVKFSLSKQGRRLRCNARADKMEEELQLMRAEYELMVKELTGCSMPLSEFGEKVMAMHDLGVRMATFELEVRRERAKAFGKREKGDVFSGQ